MANYNEPRVRITAQNDTQNGVDSAKQSLRQLAGVGDEITGAFANRRSGPGSPSKRCRR